MTFFNVGGKIKRQEKTGISNLSHRGMRAIRIEACETFASRHARHSHRGMRDIRIEACETFPSLEGIPYYKCS